MHGYENKHLRFPHWKEHLDWSHEGIKRDANSGNARRFGSFHKIEDLMIPQGEEFLKKKNICFFTTHLNEPRKSFYLNFSKNFRVDGYGKYFDKSIKDHNSSHYKKKDIMKNYAFNLCPENSMNPGNYTEKILDSFIGKCLPISWADNNINYEFNQKAFINLNDYLSFDLQELFQSLRDESFLKKYLFSDTKNSNQYKSRVPLPQIDVAETDQAYYFQIELPEVQQQNVEKEVNQNENSLVDNKQQGIMDLITQNYKRAIQRSITPNININECELNTSFIDSVLRITVLKKNDKQPLQTSRKARKEIKLFFA
jgi:HSP20 family molecular chaperone IbpA